MSIDKRGASFFKVREDLNGSKTARRNIKVLTDLRGLLGSASYRHAGLNRPEERGLGAAQRLWLQRPPFFRSVRTYMSIDKRGASFFKVREDLHRTETARRRLRS